MGAPDGLGAPTANAMKGTDMTTTGTGMTVFGRFMYHGVTYVVTDSILSQALRVHEDRLDRPMVATVCEVIGRLHPSWGVPWQNHSATWKHAIVSRSWALRLTSQNGL